MIKKASLNDIPIITEIEKNSGINFPHNAYDISKTRLENSIRRRMKKGEFFFLYDNIGYISILKKYRDGSQINYLSIHKNHHRKGIGTKLLKKAEQFIKSLKKKKVYVYCWYKNPALLFYIKNNYKIVDWQANRYSWGDPALILCKNL